MKTKRIVKAVLGIDGKLRTVDPRTGRSVVIVPRFDPRRAKTPAASRPDADTPWLTKRELAEMKPISVARDVDVAALRKRLKLSQSVFAAQFGITLAVLRDWEQGRRRPDATARAFLKVILREPDAVRRALQAP
jgi:DNA-binding transcriptional regulator YiaG